MRILIADAFPAEHVDQLLDVGHEVVHEPTLDEESIVDRIGGFDVLIVRSTKVTEPAIDASDSLSLIIRAGAGTNTIATDAAAARAIYVCNVPGKNAIAVAELTMGLILALDRNIPDNVSQLRAGEWNKKRFSVADGLYGKTMGILGLGAIGLEVARRARAFGIATLAVARDDRAQAQVTAAESAGVSFVATTADLLARSDIVTIHLPLTNETRGMVNGDFLGQCRDGAWIINTSRGEVIDEAALLAALDERGMRAGLDVYPDEPSAGTAEYRSALANHPSVYGTHHIGASTDQAQRSIADAVLEIIADYRRGVIGNCVNLETKPKGTCSVSVRHLDKVGVLSGVLAVLREADLNVGEMENRIFEGSKAAVANIRVSRSIPDDVAQRIADVPHVIGVRVNHEEQS